MKVVIIGSGNVATVLGRKIFEAGNEIIQIVGRNVDRVSSLSSSFNSEKAYNLLNINNSADVYIIAVSDSSIPEIAGQLKLEDKLIVHTAASVRQKVLEPVSKNYGVLYPLQTLKSEMETIPPIPILVDGVNDNIKKTIADFAAPWADTVGFASDEERLKLHVAAVIVNNFTNYLFTLGNQYCEIEGLNFNMLQPLIKETIARIESNKPSAVQTGPALRNDYGTINRHLELLKNHPLISTLYKTLSDSIIEYYSASSCIINNR